MPDNITSNGRDTFRVALFLGPDGRKSIDLLISKPFVRKIIYRISKLSNKIPNQCGYVLGVDLNGKVTNNLQDPTGEKYAFITSAAEHDGKLYLGTAIGDSIGIVSLE